MSSEVNAASIVPPKCSDVASSYLDIILTALGYFQLRRILAIVVEGHVVRCGMSASREYNR